MAKYVENFNEWASSMYDEYMRVSKPNRARWKVCHYVDRYSIRTTLIDLKKVSVALQEQQEQNIKKKLVSVLRGHD